MDDEKLALFGEYARLQAEASAIKERMEALRPTLLHEMLEVDGKDTKIETSIGNFTVSERSTWEYPEDIIKAEEHVKEAKKNAQKTGAAKETKSFSLYYRAKKNV